MRREHYPEGGITADQVRAERVAQGLPPTVTDPETLALLAMLLRAPRAEKVTR